MSRVIPQIVESFDQASQSLITWMIASGLGSIVALAIAVLLWRLCGRRLTPRFGLWLFMIVLLKPLVSVSIPLPQNLAMWTPDGAVQMILDSENPSVESDVVVAKMAAPVFPSADTDGLNVESIGLQKHALLTPPSVSQTTAIANERKSQLASAPEHSEMYASLRQLSWPAVVAVLYLIVVMVLLFKWAVRQRRFTRQIRNAKSIRHEDLQVDLVKLCEKARLAPVIRVVELPDITSPAVCGIRHPTLILPSQLWRSLSTEQLNWIVLQELAHVVRFDIATQYLQRCLLIFQFCLPVGHDVRVHR